MTGKNSRRQTWDRAWTKKGVCSSILSRSQIDLYLLMPVKGMLQ